MLRLLERSVATAEQRMMVVAPPGIEVPAGFRNSTVDPTLREALVRQIQRLRGSIYLADGAIGPAQLSLDGRHRTPEDARSWHILFLNAQNDVSSAIWFLRHDQRASVDDLRVRNCSLMNTKTWRDRVVTGIRADLERARQQGLACAEVGGWAVQRASRCATDGLMVVLATFALANVLGGAYVVTTATERHCSSRILRRLGGSSLEAEGTPIPPYYDPQYDCTMDLLRFDTRRPNPKYSSLVQRLQDKLSVLPVIATAIAPALADTYEFPEVPALLPAVAF